MSNQLLPILLFSFISGSTLLSGQVAAIDLPDPALEPQPFAIILSGIAPEGSDDTYRTFFLSAEHPFTAYHHAGISYTTYLPDNDGGYYNQELQKGSYEVGVFSKFFLHGRLSGRRSHLFLVRNCVSGHVRKFPWKGFRPPGLVFLSDEYDKNFVGLRRSIQSGTRGYRVVYSVRTGIYPYQYQSPHGKLQYLRYPFLCCAVHCFGRPAVNGEVPDRLRYS